MLGFTIANNNLKKNVDFMLNLYYEMNTTLFVNPKLDRL